MLEPQLISELGKFGKRMRAIRELRDMTLTTLGVLADIDRSTLCKYEKGKVNYEIRTLWKIATALQVRISDLTNYNAPLPDNSKYVAVIPSTRSLKRTGK